MSADCILFLCLIYLMILTHVEGFAIVHIHCTYTSGPPCWDTGNNALMYNADSVVSTHQQIQSAAAAAAATISFCLADFFFSGDYSRLGCEHWSVLKMEVQSARPRTRAWGSKSQERGRGSLEVYKLQSILGDERLGQWTCNRWDVDLTSTVLGKLLTQVPYHQECHYVAAKW